MEALVIRGNTIIITITMDATFEVIRVIQLKKIKKES